MGRAPRNLEEEHKSARFCLKFSDITLPKINWILLTKGLIYQEKHLNILLKILFNIFMD